MNCRVCDSNDCQRDERRGTVDFLLSAFALEPWRCRNCERRFHAVAAGVVRYLHARCTVCGSSDLRRMDPMYVSGPGFHIGRTLRLPAYRCLPCRNKFFSIFPLKPLDASPGKLERANGPCENTQATLGSPVQVAQAEAISSKG